MNKDKLKSLATSLGFRCANVVHDDDGYLLNFWFGCQDYWVLLDKDYESSVTKLYECETYIKDHHPELMLPRQQS